MADVTVETSVPALSEKEKELSPMLMPEGPDDLPIPTAIDPASPSAQLNEAPMLAGPPVEEDPLADPLPLAAVPPPPQVTPVEVAVEAPVAPVEIPVEAPAAPVETAKEPPQETSPPEPLIQAAPEPPKETPVEPVETPVAPPQPEPPKVTPEPVQETPPPPPPQPPPQDTPLERKQDDAMELDLSRRQYFSDDDEIDDELFSAEKGLYSLSALAGSRSHMDLMMPLEGGSDEQLESIQYDPIIPTFAQHDDDDERIQKRGVIVIKVPTASQGYHHNRGNLPELQRTATPEPFEEIIIPTLGPIKEDIRGEEDAKITDSIDAMMRLHRPDPNMIGRMRFDDEELYGDDDGDYDVNDYAGDMAADIELDDDLDAFLDELDDKPKPKPTERKRTNSEQKVNPMFVTSLDTTLSEMERGIVTYDDDELKKKHMLEDGGFKEKALEVLESAQEVAEHAFGQSGTYAEKAGVIVAKALKMEDKIHNQSMFRWIGFGLVAAVLLIVLLIVGLTLGSSKKAVVSTGEDE